MPTPPARWTSAPIWAHGADRRPRVDHRVRPDPGADVHVARHQDHAARRGTSRSAPTPAERRARRASRVVLERDLVLVLERPDLDRLDLAQPEVLEDRRLRLLVDEPVAVDLLGDAHLAAVERRDRSPRRRASQHLLQDLGRRRALLERRHEREADVALAGRRRGIAPGETRTPCSSSRSANASELAVGHLEPEVHRRARCRRLAALALEQRRAGASASRDRARASARRAPRRPRQRPRRAGRTPAVPCRRSAGTPSAQRPTTGRPAANPHR